MGLESEPVDINQHKDPRAKFREEFNDYDVTEEELNFLVDKRNFQGRWQGKHVELNAMTSPQMVAWLEGKFAEHRIEKVIPDRETLTTAWRRAKRRAELNRELNRIIKDTKNKSEICEPPPNLLEQLQHRLAPGDPRSWDQIIAELAESK